MAWNRWYAFRSYLRGSLWIVPFIALLLEQVTFRGIHALDARLTWIPPWPLGVSGTQTALQTIITLNPLLYRVHIRLAARCHSGCERATDPAYHRHHVAA